MSRRRILQCLAGTCLLLLCAGLYSELAPAARTVLDSGQFDLQLSADKEVYALGERPAFKLTLTNNSGRSRTLVLPVDGSGRGRYPSLKWTITPPADALPEEQIGYCGNTNPLRAEDFVRAANGGKIELLNEGGPEHTELDRGPGEYALSAAYSTDETDVERWLGGPMSTGQQTMLKLKMGPKLARVPRFTVSSNTIKIRYEAASESLVQLIEEGTQYESILALRIVEQHPEALAEISGAILKRLQGIGDFSTWEDDAFAAKAVPLLAKLGSAGQIEELWAMAFPATAKKIIHMPRTESPMNAGLVQAVLRMPQPGREERLLTLFTAREQGNCKLLAGPRILDAFSSDPGADITRCIETIAQECEYPGDADLYRGINEKRASKFARSGTSR